jgi:hypothetical protein
MWSSSKASTTHSSSWAWAPIDGGASGVRSFERHGRSHPTSWRATSCPHRAHARAMSTWPAQPIAPSTSARSCAPAWCNGFPVGQGVILGEYQGQPFWVSSPAMRRPRWPAPGQVHRFAWESATNAQRPGQQPRVNGDVPRRRPQADLGQRQRVRRGAEPIQAPAQRRWHARSRATPGRPGPTPSAVGRRSHRPWFPSTPRRRSARPWSGGAHGGRQRSRRVDANRSRRACQL